MSVLGWFLAVCGLIGVFYGFLQQRKGKKLASAPFRRPTELLQMGPNGADPRGMVSTEGTVNLGPQPLIAPMSGEPCIAYEIVVERKYEKYESTENGTQTSTNKESLMNEFRGAMFQITDAGGGVMVDATKRPDAAFETSHTSTMPIGAMIPGVLTFGRMQVNTPHFSGEGHTKEFIGTEKIIRPTPNMYALGQITLGAFGPTIATPAGIGTGSLILSSKGREALVGATARNQKLGFGIGGVVALVGTLMGLFGPAPSLSGSGGCNITNTGSCSGRVTSDTGSTYTWTVSQPGVYNLRVNTPTGVRYPMDPTLEILRAGQRIAYNDDSPNNDGLNSFISMPMPAGTYQLRIRDLHGHAPRGGYSFEMQITSAPAVAPDPNAIAAAAAAAANAAAIAAPAPAAGPVAIPADAPRPRSAQCARTMRCCIAAQVSNPVGPAACYQFARLPTNVCNANLPAQRMLVQRLNPGAIASCD